MAEWNETAHPRGPDGKFGPGGSESKAKGLGTWAANKSGEGQSLAEKMGVKEADPKEFKEAFTKAFAGSEFSEHVTHYSEEQLAGMKCFLSDDGKAGVVLHDHGDGRIEATALFNSGVVKGGGLAMLDHAIKNGANYVECYGPVLNKMYEKLGFEVQDKFAFDPSMASPKWNAEKFDHPDYHTMKLASSVKKAA